LRDDTDDVAAWAAFAALPCDCAQDWHVARGDDAYGNWRRAPRGIR